jgi:poly(hydroxyalkanoate) depolymerase family esterase
MYLYTPSPQPAAGAPVVLAMHACTHDAATYRYAGWDTIADQYGFYVVYPEQQAGNNALKCFNWAGEYSDPTNLKRGEGENQSIKEMVDTMIATYGVDATRVFAMGHSAGGAQTALLMATWPDVFAAGGVIAGIPFHCTTQYAEVTTCLNPGKNLTPDQWGEFVRQAYVGYTGPYPRLSVWHGDADTLVNPLNQSELIEQWANVHGIDTTPDATDAVGMHTHEQYHDGNGNTVIESYRIAGAAHGTFIDDEQGCGAEGAYFLDADICAAWNMATFFGITDGTTTSGSGPGSTGAGGPNGSNGAGAGEACVPGREVICACPEGGESFKTCAADGSGYGACDCGTAEETCGTGGCTAAPRPVNSRAWLLVACMALAITARRKRRPQN